MDLEEGVYVSDYGTEEVQIRRIKAALSNSTFLDVVMFLTLPRHAAGGWTQVGKPPEARTNMGVLSMHMHIRLLLRTCFKRVCVCVCARARVYAGNPVVVVVTHH